MDSGRDHDPPPHWGDKETGAGSTVEHIAVEDYVPCHLGDIQSQYEALDDWEPVEENKKIKEEEEESEESSASANRKGKAPTNSLDAAPQPVHDQIINLTANENAPILQRPEMGVHQTILFKKKDTRNNSQQKAACINDEDDYMVQEALKMAAARNKTEVDAHNQKRLEASRRARGSLLSPFCERDCYDSNTCGLDMIVQDEALGLEQQAAKRKRALLITDLVAKNKDKVSQGFAEQRLAYLKLQKEKTFRRQGIKNNITFSTTERHQNSRKNKSSRGLPKGSTDAFSQMMKASSGNKNTSGFGNDMNIDRQINRQGIQSESAAEDVEGGAIVKDEYLRTQVARLIGDIPAKDVRRVKKDTNSLKKACESFPSRSITENKEGDTWNLRGLKTPLKHHQVLGSSWMLDQENGGSMAKGGMNADEMGFGKTLQTIAVMVSNLPKLEKKPRSTLIVCPGNLVTQWMEQIKEHTQSGFGLVAIHKVGNRLRFNEIEEVICQSFCIITTYDEIRTSWIKAQCPPELAEDHQIENWHHTEGKNRLGLLHRIPWHRIVLDECQQIKNHKSKTAQACHLLEAEYRWLLGGTPLVNSVTELYSYLCFLRIKVASESFEKFRLTFVNAENGKIRMQKLISAIMIRRSHNDTILKKKPVDLPKCYRHDIRVILTPLERKLYEVCKERLRCVAKKGFKEGDFKQCNILVLILRLRQIVSHPFIAGDTIGHLLTAKDHKEIKSFGESIEEDSEDYEAITDLRKVLDEIDARAKGKEVASSVYDLRSNGGEFGRQEATGRETLRALSQISKGRINGNKRTCCFCGEIPCTDEVRVETSCGHLYCKTCLEEYQLDMAGRGYQQNPCMECGTIYTCTQELNEPSKSSRSRKTQRETGENQNFSWITNDKGLIPSTKLKAVKSQVLSWLAEDPEAKIIVYTQFKPTMMCLERLCRDEKWSYLSYHSRMNAEKRDEKISAFREKPEMKILLATLQSGGLGLNLTCANKIINIDLWWNSALENQAFCRIFRIGQQRVTNVTRLVAANTIDEKILELQARKHESISAALNDNNSMPNLDANELMSLFEDVL